MLKRYWNRLTVRFTVYLCAIFLILGAVFIVALIDMNRSAESAVRDGVDRVQEIYRTDFNARLSTVRLLLSDVYIDFDDLNGLGDPDEKTDYLARYNLKEAMEQKIDNGSDLDGLFILYDGGILRKYSARIPRTEWLTIYDYMQSYGGTIPTVGRQENGSEAWSTIRIGNYWYLVNACKTGAYTVIAMIRIETLFELLASYEGTGHYLLLNEEGDILLSSGRPLPAAIASAADNEMLDDAILQQYLAIEKAFDGGGLRLVFVAEKNEIHLDLNRISFILPLILLLAILSMSFLFYFIRGNVLRPISDMLVAVNEVEQGNFRYRIPQANRLQEFEKLTEEFNKMVSEVFNLRIDRYERQIELQKANLRYLQMQIRPHFYLNALTTIHSMSMQNRGEDIRRYIDVLSIHIRYMLSGGMTMARIGDELEHIRNFVEMKELCFPGCVFYMDDISNQELLEYEMPKLMALTIVENSFKYALTLYQTMNLLLRVDQYAEGEDQFVRIIVEDDGEGYPQKVLDNFYKNTDVKNGVGLINVRDTCRLCYGRDDLVRISRAMPHGSHTELLIPIQKKGKVTEEDFGNVGITGR